MSLNDMLAQVAADHPHLQPVRAAPPRPEPVAGPVGDREPEKVPLEIGDPEAFGAGALDRARNDLAQLVHGERNAGLNNVAFSLGHLVSAGLLDRDEVEAFLEGEAEALWPDRDPRNVTGTIRSGLDAGQAQPLEWVQAPKVGPARPFMVEPVPAGTTADSLEWEPPQPLTLHVPTFPVEELGWMAEPVTRLAEHLQTPVDLVAMLTLATVAATVRGRTRVAINSTWTEPLNVYVAAVLGAGETKSPALSIITRPLRDLEAELQGKASATVAVLQQGYRLQEGRVAKAEKAAVSAAGDDRGPAEEAARAEAEKLAAMVVPVEPRLLAGDVTAEGLVRLLAEQGGTVAALTAEGGLFDTLAGGRYSNGMANLDAVLQAHDGREPILVDRKVGPPLRVDSPCLTLGLAIQPQVLLAAGKSEAAVGRGFLARFLYTLPASRVGGRRMRRTAAGSFDAFRELVRVVDAAMPAADISARITPYRGAIADVADVSLRSELRLSSSSLDMFYAYLEHLEPRRHPSRGDLGGHLGAWANKMDGQLARLAALLHLIQNTRRTSATSAIAPQDVPLETMKSACRVADYLIEHAVAAHRLMHGQALAESDTAVQLHGWVTKHGLAEFTVREAHNGLRGRVDFREAEAVHLAAAALVEKGYLRPVDVKGTRTAKYLVNPLSPEAAR